MFEGTKCRVNVGLSTVTCLVDFAEIIVLCIVYLRDLRLLELCGGLVQLAVF